MTERAWMRRALRAVFAPLAVAVALAGCLNPFAPEEGGVSAGLWEPQVTIGGMLRNFQTAYTLRDSFRYADVIAEEFVFQFFDASQNRYDQWYSDTELRTTGALLRSFERLDLRWGPIPAAIDTFSQPDTTVEFTVNFTLTAGDFSPIDGFARFQTRAGEDGRFRIVQWRDDY
ncbi:MAG: hypothetical protein MAG453_00395 [Calditrichaeota bacterium]|nr:hypothetical protein [Calditrichota bacterium]